MRTIRTGLFVAAAAFLFNGCVVVKDKHHHHHHGRSKHALKHHKRCHPSQYWDGHKCRHKGKGHGARKHDH